MPPELQMWATMLGFGLSLLAAAAAAAGQASLFHINRSRIRHLMEGGLPRAKALLKVSDEPTHMFVTILVLGALGAAGVIVSSVFLAVEYGTAWPWGTLGFVLGGLVWLLIAQMVARTIAVARPEPTGLFLVGPLGALGVLFAPLVFPLRALERSGLGLLGMHRSSEPGAVAEEELRMLVESVEDSTALEQDERQMIHGIFEMSQRPAREVMVPRIDITAVPHDVTIRQALDQIVESGYSRIPVYGHSLDKVVGVVYAKDILRHLREGTLDDPVGPITRPPYFVPDSKKIDELLEDLQEKRVHLAIVVDEYGGTAGLLTIEDLLEEIVGEIQDEYDQHEEEPVQQLSEREAIVEGRTPVRVVNEALALHLNVEEFDTVGGLVYHELGHLPSEGDEVRVDGALVRVLSTQGRRIKKVRVTRVEAPE